MGNASAQAQRALLMSHDCVSLLQLYGLPVTGYAYGHHVPRRLRCSLGPGSLLAGTWVAARWDLGRCTLDAAAPAGPWSGLYSCKKRKRV